MKHIILIVSLVLAGCATGEGDTTQHLVYESKQEIQCESKGISLQTSAKKLSAQQVQVYTSHCGQLTGMAFPAVCGSGTAAILLHQIAKTDIAKALKMGFKDVRTLSSDTGLGYALETCAP